MNVRRIVLASTSRYRAALLRRIVPGFEQTGPDVDERELPGEEPQARARRLAVAKAEAVAATHPDAIVIGSDQVAARGVLLLHKPGNLENARAQLRAASTNAVDFFTAVCVIEAHAGKREQATDHTRAVFRALTDPEIERYLARERPLDCAGSFKVEGAGIALLERIETTDPTALIGLPLIALARMLRELGASLP